MDITKYQTFIKPRQVKYRWVLEQVDENTQRVLDLQVFNYAGRGYTASLNPVTLSKRDGYTMESFKMFSGKRLGQEQCHRHSQKAMIAFAEGQLAYFLRNHEAAEYAEYFTVPAEEVD
jgi:hypothetical protein